mmetsp:Transcript_63907/g.195444  ORF Transcript_63907/g.195444 Transcript_63907/m.195444 type:complete len:254 (-) Transcript_63907:271-1032(-)
MVSSSRWSLCAASVLGRTTSWRRSRSSARSWASFAASSPSRSAAFAWGSSFGTQRWRRLPQISRASVAPVDGVRSAPAGAFWSRHRGPSRRARRKAVPIRRRPTCRVDTFNCAARALRRAKRPAAPRSSPPTARRRRCSQRRPTGRHSRRFSVGGAGTPAAKVATRTQPRRRDHGRTGRSCSGSRSAGRRPSCRCITAANSSPGTRLPGPPSSGASTTSSRNCFTSGRDLRCRTGGGGAHGRFAPWTNASVCM